MNKRNFTDLTELSLRTDVAKSDLEKMVRRLVKIYDPLRIYLFGSFAYGNPHINSDLDFVAIVPTEEEANPEQWDKSGKAFDWFEEKYVDFLLYSKQKFEKMISSPATMEHKIYKKGIVMYSKPDLAFDENQPMVQIEKTWYKEAENSFIIAKKLLADEERDLKKAALFHLQQSIEMALRAFRAFHLLEIKKSHKLDYFWGHCKRLDPDFEASKIFPRRSDAVRITRYYWFRYNHEMPIPDMQVIQQDFRRAEAVLKLVGEKIAK